MLISGSLAQRNAFISILIIFGATVMLISGSLAQRNAFISILIIFGATVREYFVLKSGFLFTEVNKFTSIFWRMYYMRLTLSQP